MICKKCQEENKKSTVSIGAGTSTLMWCPPFYDEEGNYHSHDSNRHSTELSCSNGHSWVESTTASCPTCGDNW